MVLSERCSANFPAPSRVDYLGSSALEALVSRLDFASPYYAAARGLSGLAGAKQRLVGTCSAHQRLWRYSGILVLDSPARRWFQVVLLPGPCVVSFSRDYAASTRVG